MRAKREQLIEVKNMMGQGGELLSDILQKVIRQPKDSELTTMYNRAIRNLKESGVMEVLNIAPKYVNIHWKHIRGPHIDNWVCISHRAVRFCSKYGDKKGLTWYDVYDVFYVLNEYLKEYGKD